ncbi:BREX-2 system phosphatase PglZ [Candidatus Binatia bacterium]|nr:BREX-2 system phosphatase PglZ [Candidatus Binatia bacterium]
MTALTAASLRPLVEEILRKGTGARVIGIRSQDAWSGAPTLHAKGVEWEVATCPSALAVRERLSRRRNGAPPLIFLTPLSEPELGEDVLARLARRRLFNADGWVLVFGLFAARDMDPRLAQERWMAEALLAAAPPGGYPPVASGILDRVTAWRTVLSRHLGLETGQPDATALLEWSMVPGNVARYVAAQPGLRTGLRGWVEQTAGAVGVAVLDCCDAGFGAEALPVGLVCGVVHHPAAAHEVELARASVRLDRYANGQTIAPEVGRRWADEAKRIVGKLLQQQGPHAASPWLQRADAVLDDVQARPFAHLSDVLLSGFAARLERYGRCLSPGIAAPGSSALADLCALASDVREHQQAPRQSDRVRQVDMSLRLARWLLVAAGAGEAPDSLVDAAIAYAREGAFVDWARGALRGGDSVAALGAAYDRLLAAVTERREQQSRCFGELFASWSAAGSTPGPAILIERVLDRVLVPLARTTPVLLLVVDGMSCAVFRELADDLTRLGWTPLAPTAQDEAWSDRSLASPVVIAAFPTVTEVCRTSLLCGNLTSGGDTVEKRGLAEHRRLLEVSKVHHPPVLFHKAELTDAGGSDLSPDVRGEIASTDRRVVGVVLNAVDDHLAKSEQLRIRWTADAIHLLHALLYEAQAAGRAIVLASDHGHVHEVGGELRKADQGQRWRVDDGTRQDDEVVVAGPRVDRAKGPRVIAPWSERVRYGAKKNGYHGGASPQEVVVPLAVLAPASVSIDGWNPIPLRYPAWWTDDVVVPAPPAKRQPPRKRTTDAGQGKLFEPPPTKHGGPGWIDALFGSEVFMSQRAAASRAAVPDDTIRELLAALDDRGGKLTRAALVQRLGLPAVRVHGIVAAMRRLLNVDGYDILSVDDTSDTVALDVEMLRVQFELA